MKQSLLALLALLLLQNAGYAQKQGNIWYFGKQAGLDFNSGSPTVLTDGAMYAIEGCATASDAAGKLLFYTNGDTVWNRNHQIMSNGIGLGACVSSTQAVVIVPWPAHQNRFFLFTTDCNENMPIGGLSYSIVDLSANGGLGSVTSKANLLYGPVTEKLLAVQDINTNTAWIISHKQESDSFICYKVTDSGISGSPVVSKIGKQYKFTLAADAGGIGEMKISPDGAMLASTGNGKEQLIDLFKFDRASGKLSDWLAVDVPGTLCYGVEFSPDNHKVYCANVGPLGDIFQFDVSGKWDSSIINSSIKVIGSFNYRNIGSLQLAPDGKIYVASIKPGWTPAINSLGVINSPNSTGESCDFVLNAVNLNGKVCALGLPQAISTDYQVTTTVESTKETSSIQCYPNPCSTEATFKLDEKISGAKTMMIFNASGIIVFSEEFSGSMIRFSRGNLPAGTYFFQLTKEGTLMARGKFSMLD